MILNFDKPDYTAEDVTEIMKSRGYEKTSTKGEHTTNYLKKVSKEVYVSASVNLTKQVVSLGSPVVLKNYCELVVNELSLRRLDFDLVEQTFITYLHLCAGLEQNSSIQPEIIIPPTPKQTIKERKMEFWDQIRQVCKQHDFPKEVALEFYNYWTAMNPDGKKFLMEIEKSKKKVFDVKRRLETWMRNDRKWQPAWKAREARLLEAQEKAVKVTKEVGDTKKLF